MSEKKPVVNIGKDYAGVSAPQKTPAEQYQENRQAMLEKYGVDVGDYPKPWASIH